MEFRNITDWDRSQLNVLFTSFGTSFGNIFIATSNKNGPSYSDGDWPPLTKTKEVQKHSKNSAMKWWPIQAINWEFLTYWRQRLTRSWYTFEMEAFFPRIQRHLRSGFRVSVSGMKGGWVRHPIELWLWLYWQQICCLFFSFCASGDPS